jgi:nucleotide-binding universal stress UspA family protein
MASSTVVVGIDGSDVAREAFRMALEEARYRNGRVRAVAVWHVPWPLLSVATPGVDMDAIIKDLREDATQKLEETVEAFAGDAEGVEVIRQVFEGQPAQALVEQSAGAALLVVGSRGLGGFSGLLLGSVSQQCAQHARCPVMIVKPPDAG